jgi:hypothetical protein
MSRGPRERTRSGAGRPLRGSSRTCEEVKNGSGGRLRCNSDCTFRRNEDAVRYLPEFCPVIVGWVGFTHRRSGKRLELGCLSGHYGEKMDKTQSLQNALS